MSNAAKHRKKAAEFEQLKQIDRAIAAYIKAIEESEADGEDVDVALLNKVGDLTLRQGRVSDAVTYYERAVEHYATAGLFNNAIALCNKILRSAPGRSNVYFTLGRICAKKGLRGDATRNFLEYATRMQQDGRVDEGMRALAEVADLMPELTEVRRLVEDHAVRAGIVLPRRKTPAVSAPAAPAEPAFRTRDNKSSELIFLDVGEFEATRRNTPPLAPRVRTPAAPSKNVAAPKPRSNDSIGPESLDAFLLFDPSKPNQVTPPHARKAVVVGAPPAELTPVAEAEPEIDSTDLVLGSAFAAETGEVVDAAAASVVEALSDLELEDATAPSVDASAEPISDLTSANTVTAPDASSVELLDAFEATHDVSATSEFETQLASALTFDATDDGFILEDRDALLGESENSEREIVSEVPADEPAAVEAAADVSDTADVTDVADVIAVDEIAAVDDIAAVHDIAAVEDVVAVDDAIAAADVSNLEPTIAAESAVEPAVDLPFIVAPTFDDVIANADVIATDDVITTDDVIATDDMITTDDVIETDDVSAFNDLPAFDDVIAVEQLPMVVEQPEPVAGLESEPDVLSAAMLAADAVSDPAIDLSTADVASSDVDDLLADTPSDTSADTSADTLSWIVPADAILNDDVEPVAPLAELVLDDEPGDVLSGLVIDDFDRVADLPDALLVSDMQVGTPTYTTSMASYPRSLTPLDVSPIPELEAAIEAGALAAARAEADPEIVLRRPPFRIDPHDFILPGELPPLVVDDVHVSAGLERAQLAASVFTGSEFVAPSVEFTVEDSSIDETAIDDTIVDDTPVESASVADTTASMHVESPSDVDIHASDATDAVDDLDEPLMAETFSESARFEEATAIDEPVDTDVESALRALIEAPASPERAMSTTPALPIAAVVAEAAAIATSRRDELRAAVAAAPHDWVLRRRLAEALFEVGEREAGLGELQVALTGFSQHGHIGAASDIADELVRISPERIPYHQKRVELAVRLNDQSRLRVAYLDLADVLVQFGDDVRAHAVYVRVLEIDPWDERARAALGNAAPPAPPKPHTDEHYVSLADWLRDEDEPETTRMRMREPAVSGDEQADFDALLRHFKDGVSRSLGEEDYESHYDLGVAYKEMGLLDDAIAEFQKALRSRRHRLPAYEALGQCFVEQSRHSVAATVLTRALHEPGLGDDHRIGVLYLLAYSCEALQRWDEARSYYSRVYATDINFRDVAARLAALDQIAR